VLSSTGSHGHLNVTSVAGGQGKHLALTRNPYIPQPCCSGFFFHFNATSPLNQPRLLAIQTCHAPHPNANDAVAHSPTATLLPHHCHCTTALRSSHCHANLELLHRSLPQCHLNRILTTGTTINAAPLYCPPCILHEASACIR
jgi:hypothetical protein